jgi:hypothetical protein
MGEYNIRGRHFQIEYKFETNKYCVRDLGVGFGTFAKLDFPLVRLLLIRSSKTTTLSI